MTTPIRLLTLLATALLLAGATLLWRWTQTPHGPLTLPSALISQLARLQASAQPPDDWLAQRASRRAAMHWMSAPGPVLAFVADRQIDVAHGRIPVRLYAREAPAPSATTHPAHPARPALVYFHGGGWALGDLDSHDHLCRQLAAKTGAVVMAVDYRLAPEHRYPAAFDDALAAVRWLAEHARTLGVDHTRLVVAGDSAGGNLAAATALHLRDESAHASTTPRLAAQVLIYPALDLARLDRPSMHDFAEGYFLTRARMEAMIANYVPDPAQRREPRASPLLATDLRGLPPTYLLTAQFDPLRDEGRAFVQGLQAAGVAVTHWHVPGVIHGFASMDRWFPESAQASDAIAAFLLHSGITGR